MNDFKSKLPDLKEIGSMTGKLFNDIKSSVCEIIQDYKEKREPESDVVEPKENVKKTTVKPSTSAEAPPAAKVKPEETPPTSQPEVQSDELSNPAENSKENDQ